jgi:hypothetical protein
MVDSDEPVFPHPAESLRELAPEIVARWNAWRASKRAVLAGTLALSDWEAEGSALAALDEDLPQLVAGERYQFERQRAARR